MIHFAVRCSMEWIALQAVGIACEYIAQRGGLLFGRFQFSDLQPHEWPTEFYHDAAIGRQISLADDSADGAFTTDQNSLDVAAVLVRNHERHKTRSARKVDGIDIVTGVIEEAAGGAVVVRQMWV